MGDETIIDVEDYEIKDTERKKSGINWKKIGAVVGGVVVGKWALKSAFKLGVFAGWGECGNRLDRYHRDGFIKYYDDTGAEVDLDTLNKFLNEHYKK